MNDLRYFLLFLPFSICSIPFESYQCGTSKSSRMTSWILTASCEQEQMNRCCISHDSCYDSCKLPQSQCDQIFCNCLFAVPSTPICRNLIESLHCTAVQLLGDNYICASQAEPLFPLKKTTTFPPAVTPRITSTINSYSNDYPTQYHQFYQYQPILPPPIRPSFIGYSRNR
ncbi:hypothetical protein PRIPAC_84553 [Pristionchus pacificus]|nr:hypothetical protein PRIPAC_84553 [Pristionchus pacificus]